MVQIAHYVETLFKAARFAQIHLPAHSAASGIN